MICIGLRFEICLIQSANMIWLSSKFLNQSKICFTFHFDSNNQSLFKFKTNLLYCFGKSKINPES